MTVFFDTTQTGALNYFYLNLSSLRYIYGHENEMYNVGVSLKEGEGLKMRELRVSWEKVGDKTKCAKG